MRRVFVPVVAVGALCVAASAQQIVDPNLITLQHDFEVDPPNVPPVGPFTLGNATFSEASSGSGGPGWRLLNGFPTRVLTDNAGISDITVTFDTPMLRAGLLNVISGRYQIDFFSPGGALLGTVINTVPDNGSERFAGWGDAGGIGSINVTEFGVDNGLVGGIDDIRYDLIPAPSSLALLGLGGLVATRRRR